MSRADALTTPLPAESRLVWRGLGLWNLYFIAKLALYWGGAIDFAALANLVFAAFLLAPLPPRWLHRLRHLAAIPIGVALFYHDTWLPPFERLLAQSSQVGAMSPAYLLELAGRIVNWEWLGVLFVLTVGYGFVAPWIRVSVPVVLGLVWLAVAPLLPVAGPVPQESALAALPDVPNRGLAAVVQRDEPVPADEASDAVLDRRLEAFYAAERQRRTAFAARPADAAPFDVLVINICSLSWDDMAVAGLVDHPLFGYLDAVFDNFNSATSYSGPAGIRLLQASCGQLPHGALYGDAPRECQLFENLAELGFAQNLVLNHDGQFDGYLKELQQEGGLDAPKLPMDGLAPVMTAFDDSPVYADRATLERWAAQDAAEVPSATFYNTVSLHDGNRYVGQRGFAEYRQRLVTLFDDLLAFLQRLDSEGRRVAVLIVPEHGAALRGDKMQFPGMREIPNPTLTHVPVGLKLTGMAQPRQGEPLRVSEPTSYLAISELISRLVASDVFTGKVDWQGLLSGLPSTAPVSENEAVVMMPYREAPYIRLRGDGWMPYPQ